MSQHLSRIARRNVLQAIGLGGGAALFPSLSPRRAEAAVAPKRFLVYFTYHGTLPKFWTPTGSETDFTVNELMKPYESYKKDLILLDGLDMKSQQNGDPGNAHQVGHNQALVANKPISADLAGGPSIDQVIQKGLADSGVKTKFPSLELGVTDNGSFPSYHYIAYPAAGQKLPSEGDPRRVWTRVFKDFVPTGGGTPVPVGPDPAKVKQKSVLDYVRAEVTSYKTRMGANDKKKLDSHLQAVRDLEVRLGVDGSSPTTPGAVSAGCAAVPQSAATLGGFNAILDSQIRLIQMAFACDLTRVASLNIEELSHGTSGYPGGAFGSTDVHDLIHKTSPDNGNLRDNAAAVDVVRKYHLVYANAFGKLLTALGTMMDVDGKRVLDNTIILWAGEIALGSHTLQGCRWMLAGSGGGALRTGRWLKCNGAPHQNAFVSIANAMGVNITTFGNPATCTGKLGVL